MIAVVFPAPFPPTIAKNSPQFTVRFSPFITSGRFLSYLKKAFLIYLDLNKKSVYIYKDKSKIIDFCLFLVYDIFRFKEGNYVFISRSRHLS